MIESLSVELQIKTDFELTRKKNFNKPSSSSSANCGSSKSLRSFFLHQSGSSNKALSERRTVYLKKTFMFLYSLITFDVFCRLFRGESFAEREK